MQLVECKACGSRELSHEGGAIVCAYCQAVYIPDAITSIAISQDAPETLKTEFDVVLEDSGRNKIAVIKNIRELNGSGLREAKNLAESCPRPVLSGVSKSVAEAAKTQLEKAGATVTIV